MKALNRVLVLAIASLFLAASLTFAQDSTKSKNNEHEKEMPAHSGKMDKKGGEEHGMMKNMKGMKHEKSAVLDSSVIRKGEIDLKAIDENKDGKVYQCQMDFNVLSDKPGKDPNCEMKLEEVSLEKAKKNLISKNYKVK